MAYALAAAGARTPRLVGTSEVGTEAALLAYEHVPGRRLTDVPDEEITDALLTDVWRQFRAMQGGRLAHQAARRRRRSPSARTAGPTSPTCGPGRPRRATWRCGSTWRSC